MQAFGIRRLFALAVLCFAAVAPLALAQTRTNPPYFLVDPPQNATTTDKLEVAEVFSYACIHCAQFQDHIDAWRKTLDTKKVEFVYVPSPYNAVDTLLARGYLAAKSLGVAEKTHHAMFQALHERGIQVRTLDNVVSLYVQLGVPADKMSKAVKDFFVDAELRRTYELMLKYKIDGTPTLLVAGKYRITSDSAGGYAEMIKVADKLVAQELAQKTATSRQAPNKGK